MQNPQTSTMRLVADQDIHRISQFLSAEMGSSTDTWQSIMRHWWHDNPAFEAPMVMGWIIVDEGNIVGFLGNIPTRFQFNGRTIVTQNPTTWFVASSYRGNPLSRQLFREFGVSADTTLSFITTPAKHVVRFYQQEMRYQEFPEQPREFSYYVYRHAEYLRLASSRKLRLRHAPFLPLYRWWQRKMVQPYAGNLAVRRLDPLALEFADLIDRFWANTRDQYKNTLCRDSATLQWLLSGHRAADKFIYGCFDNDELAGFGIFIVKIDDGRKVLESLDYWALSDLQEVIAAIAAKLIDAGPQHDPVFLKLPLFNREHAAAAASLNLPRAKLRNYYMVRYGATIKRKMEPHDTFLSGMHGDYALF